MAYNATKSQLVDRVDGRRHIAFWVTETEVTSGDTYEITRLPVFFTITLFESKLVDAGSASGVNPVVEIDDSDAPVSPVAENDAESTNIRNQCDIRVVSRSGVLTIRSLSGVSGTANEVVSQITIVEGHG